MKFSITILLTSCVVAFLCFVSCNREAANPVNRLFPVSAFNKIIAGDDHEITVTTGTVFSVQAKGDASDLEDLRMTVSNGTLKIDYPHYDSYRKRVHITITMPQLFGVEFSGSTYGTITTFQQNVNFSVYLSGNSNFTITNNAPLIYADISGNAALSLNGNAAALVANVSGQSVYNAYGLTATDNAVIKSGGNSKVYVNVSRAFTVEGSGQSKIFYKGNPSTKNFTVNEMSELVKQ